MEEILEQVEGGFSVSACLATVERQKRILSELRDQANILPKKVKTRESLHDEEHPHDVKIECQRVVDKFKNLKAVFVQLQSRIKLLDYLDNVPRDQWPSVAACDEESKKTRRQLKDAKADVSDLEEHIQNMMKQVQNSQETLNLNLESFEKMVDGIADGAAEIEQQLETRQGGTVLALEGSCVDLENFQESFGKQNEELKAAEEFVAHYQPLLRSRREGTESIRKEQQLVLAQTEEATQDLLRQIAEKSDKEKQQSDKMKWRESASKKLTELTGVSDRSFDGHCWILELTTAGYSHSNKEGLVALLSLHFKSGPESWTPKQLSTATIDIDTLDISDLVEEAVRRNNVTFLVSAVMKRLNTHAPLFMEVEQLRHQYAIDWVPEEGILRVIFGDSAQIVCTLSLATGPQGSTVVQLKSIEGVVEHPPIEGLKPLQDAPRIWDWLAYLQEAVTSL